MSDLLIRLFGPFEASLEGRPMTHFRTTKVQALLVYLVTEPSIAHQREALMALLWPDLPLESAQINLRQILYQLRKSIPEVASIDGNGRVPLLLSERQTVQINPAAAVHVDARAFAAHLEDVRRHEHADWLSCSTCTQRLEDAVALYRGPFLADFYLEDSNEFEDWAHRRREAYRRQVMDTLAALGEIHLRRGDYVAAQGVARRQLELDDLDERAARQLMEALAREGRRGEALTIYGDLRRRLHDELAMAPSVKTSRLSEQIDADALETRAQQPATVRGYKLLSELGAGTFGVVHRAIQPGVGREVAIKIIHPRYANHPDFIRRFEAEAQTIARLEHPHVVPLYDYWREPDNAYLVMRWLRGGNLERWLAEGPLPPDAAVRIVDQIAAALYAAHRQHIIHRDIKAANILLDEDRNAYLSDFSLATQLSLGESSVDFVSTIETASPEQLLGEALSPQADQYSLGVVVYRILAGERPYPPGLTPEQLQSFILEQSLPRLAQTRGLPPAVDEVIQRATARLPGDRFPDTIALAQAFRRALNGAAGTSGTVVSHEAIAVVGTNPYKGLRAFQESDAATFFGREALVTRLAAHLDEGRFLAVIGPSGSGKSSAVKAGLIPALRRGVVDGSEHWFITEMTPGRFPFKELEQALTRVAVNPPAELLESLERDYDGLGRVLRRVLPSGSQGETSQLLLVIDQFEELFTLTDDEGARSRFIDSLLTALDEDDAQLRVIATLRADFYDRPLEVPGLGPLLRDRTAVVLPMSHAELEEAISRPAALSGVRLEPRLLATVLADTAGQPGSLPLAQYALTELFERRNDGLMTIEAYQEIGGVSGALGRRADEICETLSPAEQQAARQMFLRLVTLGEGVEDTRRRVLRSELEALDIGEADMSTVIDAFGRYRLLTFDHDPLTRGPTVDVAHEALLREWGRLRVWLDESRASVRLQRLLAAEAADWAAAGRTEGYLLRGSRLDQFEGWTGQTNVSLTATESAFLSASLAARGQRRAEEETRRQRELETARQLAETERQRAEEQAANAAKLSRRALLLGVALGIAALLAVAAIGFARSSDQNAATAATRAAEANANAALAVDNANLASTRQFEAAAEADLRATAQAEANTQRDVALAREREAVEAYSLSLAANARQALESDDQQLALLLALAANQIENPPLDSWRTLVDVAYAPGTAKRYDIDSPVFSIDVSPDGLTMLVGTEDGYVRLLEIASGETLLDLQGHSDAVNAVAFSPDGRRALAGSTDKTVTLWDLETGEIIRRLTGHGNSVSAVAFMPDGRHALSGEDSGSLPGVLIGWDLESGEELRRFGGDRAEEVEGVRSLAIDPSGRYAVVGYARLLPSQDEDSIGVWDIESGELIRYLQGTERAVNSVAISSDGTLALGASDDASIYVWTLETGELLQRLDGHEGIASAVAVSPDGTTALSGAFNGGMIWWDLRSGEMLDRLNGHQQTLWGIGYLDDTHAVSVSADESIRLWDLAGRWQLARWGETSQVAFCTSDFQGGFRKVSSKMGQPVDDPGACVTDLEISPDGRTALSSSIDNTGDNVLTLWDYTTGQEIRRMAGIEVAVREVEFAPDSSHALTGHDNQTMLYWDLETGQVISRLEGHNGAITGIDISEDGMFAVTASMDGQVGYWDLVAGKMLRRMTGYVKARGAADAHFLPGERLAISSGWDGTMAIWDLGTGEQVRRLTGLEGLAGSHLEDTDFDTVTFEISISPDGRYLLSAGDDESVLLWDLASGQSIRRLFGHGDNVTSVRFTPDGQRALSSARNEALVLWDVNTGKSVRQFSTRRSSDGGFTPALAIHPDGATALTDDADGSILQWQLAEPAPVELIDWLAANRTMRELTCIERETYRIEPLCIEGTQVESTVDMLATARKTTAALTPAFQPADTPAPVAILEESAPARPPRVARLGDNRGELLRHGFDVWTYEGKADEVLSIQMIADDPLTDQTLPVDKRYEMGVMDTVLYVLRPDGSLLSRTDDDVAPDGTRVSDANILATMLPEDGVYRIEARSALDDHAGGYTLRIKPLERVWNEELFNEYVGVYLDGPWEYHLFVFMQDGRLYDYVQEGGYVEEYFPISETEFVLTDGIVERFTRDESGKVNGYDVYISLIHPVGGRWYRGNRIGDLPEDFYETLNNVLLEDGTP